MEILLVSYHYPYEISPVADETYKSQTKFSTVTKKERIEKVNVKGEDEANQVLADFLLGKGITTETLTRTLFLTLFLELTDQTFGFFF